MLGKIDTLCFSYEGISDIRNFKGFMWEQQCNRLIKQIPNITITHNPSSFPEWKSKNKDNNHDAIATINKNTVLSLEYKYRDIPHLFHSWFLECWGKRTSDIFIVNNPNCLSYEDRCTLEQRGQKVMSLTEAIVYLGSLAVEGRKSILLLVQTSLYSNQNQPLSNKLFSDLWFRDKKNR